MQLVEKQGHNPGREEEEMVLTALIVIIFLFFSLPIVLCFLICASSNYFEEVEHPKD